MLNLLVVVMQPTQGRSHGRLLNVRSLGRHETQACYLTDARGADIFLFPNPLLLRITLSAAISQPSWNSQLQEAAITERMKSLLSEL